VPWIGAGRYQRKRPWICGLWLPACRFVALFASSCPYHCCSRLSPHCASVHDCRLHLLSLARIMYACMSEQFLVAIALFSLQLRGRHQVLTNFLQSTLHGVWICGVPVHFFNEETRHLVSKGSTCSFLIQSDPIAICMIPRNRLPIRLYSLCRFLRQRLSCADA